MRREDLEDTRELTHRHAERTGSGGNGEPDRLPLGTRVGAHVVREHIGSGGGGDVYLAEPAAGAGPAVAIKVLLRELAASAQALARFQREAEVVKLIDHPNIAEVLESGSLPDGRPYIVMELVAGENLKTVLRRRGRLGAEEVLQILEPACSALAAAHAAGVIHRDLKASNISVGTHDGRPEVKLLDFGIAKLTALDPSAPGLTVAGTRLGTPYAMAPEQIRGENVDERADIYALGVLIYQMVTGRYPFSAPTPQEIERLHLEVAPPRPSQFSPVPAGLEVVLLRCLEKESARRFASVDELLAALRTAVSEPMPTATEERPAVAIYVELRAAGEEADDDLADAADLAERLLTEAGFALPFAAGGTILGARLLPAGPDEARRARQGALVVARDLRRQLEPGGRVAATICLHAAGADVVVGGEAIIGGPIVRVADWVPVVELDGVRATRGGAAGLDPTD